MTAPLPPPKRQRPRESLRRESIFLSPSCSFQGWCLSPAGKATIRDAQKGFRESRTPALRTEAALPGPLAPGLGFQPPVFFEFPIPKAHPPGLSTKIFVAQTGPLQAQSSAGEGSEWRSLLFWRG